MAALLSRLGCALGPLHVHVCGDGVYGLYSHGLTTVVKQSLRRHVPDAKPDRRQSDHRTQCVRVMLVSGEWLVVSGKLTILYSLLTTHHSLLTTHYSSTRE